MDPRNLLIFSGISSTKLAEKMAGVLHLPVGKTELVQFANTEYRLRILSKVKNKNCLVVQSTGRPANDNLMELFLLVDTLKRSGAKKITVLIPYFGYSRQHKNFRNGESVTAKMILDILASLGAGKIVTFDLHSLELAKNSKLPIQNISLLPLFSEIIARKINPCNAVVISPDEGGFERAKIFADNFFNKSQGTVVVIKKRRDLHILHKVIHEAPSENKIKGKDVIIVDDICTTGKTLLSAVNICLSQGAKLVYAVIVHADMDKATVARIIKSSMAKFFTTTTLENFQAHKLPPAKFEVIDTSKIFQQLKAVVT